MLKFKLLEARKRKNYTQEYMAATLFMDISNYSRRESGQIKINIKEWQRLAEILDVPIEQIYETEDQVFLNAKEKSRTTEKDVYNPTPTQHSNQLQKSIDKLELEVRELKEVVHHLKNLKIDHSINDSV